MLEEAVTEEFLGCIGAEGIDVGRGQLADGGSDDVVFLLAEAAVAVGGPKQALVAD